VNDVLAVGGAPLFFLDYYASSSLEPKVAAKVVEGIAEGCRLAGCALVGGETAELPGFYTQGEYDLAGFAVGVVERDAMITGKNVKAGDAVIGLGSSGLHSNGFSLVRAIIARTGVKLDDPLPGFDRPCAATLLEPTRIYVKAVLSLAAELEVRALAHITGGGLLENIPRTLPDGLGVLLEAGWPVPPIFRWIAKAGPVDEREMLRTFNMGIGMTAVVAKESAERAISILGRQGVSAQVIGQVIKCPSEDPRVVIEGVV
jgi:phosphoribosylformylglycinamidine cyclo-ligase